jgi:nicotinate phosphoribosyltransferase
VNSTCFRAGKKNLLEIFLAFGGEFTLFAGLEECLKFVHDYKFHVTDIDYLRSTLPDYVETKFYDYLTTLDMNDVKLYAVPEGKNDF